MKSLRVLLPLLLVACGVVTEPSGPAMIEVHLTDAPGEFREVVVTIDRVSVKTSATEGFEDLALNIGVGAGGAVVDRDLENGRLTVDLTELTDGRSLLLATGEVPGGALEQIRLHLVEATVDGARSPWILEDVPGAEREPLKVPSGFQSGLKIVPRNVDVPAGGLTSVTLDFDAAKSVVALGGRGKSQRAFDFILKPVVFVLESESLLRPTTTIATGLDAPAGVAYTRGDADRIVVADAGASSFVAFDPADYTEDAPVDAGEAGDAVETDDPPADVAAHDGSLFDGVFGGALLQADALDIGNGTTEDLGGDDLTAIARAGDGWLVARAGEILFVEPDADPVSLGVQGLGNVTGLAFFPGDGTFGTLVATDRGSDSGNIADDRILEIPLDDSGGSVAVAGDVSSLDATTLDFLNEPVGVAANADGSGFFVAQRGNGYIHEISLGLVPLRILDTGLGGGSLNGITAVSEPALEGFDEEALVLLLARTDGDDGSTIEALVP